MENKIRSSQDTALYFVPLHMRRHSDSAVQPVRVSSALRHVEIGKHLKSVQQSVHRLFAVLTILLIHDNLQFNTHLCMSIQLALTFSLTNLIRGYSQSQTGTVRNLHTNSLYYKLFIKVLSTGCHLEHSLTLAVWPLVA